MQTEMVKITHIAQDTTRITLKLEGRLVGQWVDALKSECERYLTRRSTILLDLSGVSFVDAQGLTTLKALRGQGVELGACSLFIAGLLPGEDD